MWGCVRLQLSTKLSGMCPAPQTNKTPVCIVFCDKGLRLSQVCCVAKDDFELLLLLPYAGITDITPAWLVYIVLRTNPRTACRDSAN